MALPVTPTLTFSEWRTTFELGLSKVHKDELRRRPKMYQDWLTEHPVSRFYDKDWSVSGLGIMPEKPIGKEFSTDQIMQGKTKQYELKTYGLMLVIQKEAMDWDLYGVIGGMTKELAKSAVDRYNLVAYSVPNNSFSAPNATYQTFQSESLVKLSHTRIDGGTWKNRPTTNLGLSYLALMQASIDMSNLVDERGRFVQVEPELLMVSNSQKWIADTILGSQYRPGNANMELNVAKEMGLRRHSSQYLTSSTAFWVFGPKDTYKISMGLGKEPDFETDNRPGTRDRLYSSYCNFRLEVYNSLGMWGSSGDGATST